MIPPNTNLLYLILHEFLSFSHSMIVNGCQLLNPTIGFIFSVDIARLPAQQFAEPDRFLQLKLMSGNRMILRFALPLIFVALLGSSPARAQSPADCRISALYIYCAMVTAVGTASLKKAGQGQLAEKLQKSFSSKFGKFKGRKGNDRVNTLFLKRAISDFKTDSNGSLLVCVGADMAKLNTLIALAKSKCG